MNDAKPTLDELIEAMLMHKAFLMIALRNVEFELCEAIAKRASIPQQ